MACFLCFAKFICLHIYSPRNDFQVNNMKVYKRWDDGFIVRRMAHEDAKARMIWSPYMIGTLIDSGREWVGG